MWIDFMRAAIANKPNEAFPEGNAPKKQLDVPLTPADSPVVKQIPKAPEEADPDPVEPEGDAGPPPAPQPPTAPTGGQTPQ